MKAVEAMNRLFLIRCLGQQEIQSSALLDVSRHDGQFSPEKWTYH